MGWIAVYGIACSSSLLLLAMMQVVESREQVHSGKAREMFVRLVAAWLFICVAVLIIWQ